MQIQTAPRILLLRAYWAVSTYPDALHEIAEEALAKIAALRLAGWGTLERLHQAESCVERTRWVGVHGTRVSSRFCVRTEAVSCPAGMEAIPSEKYRSNS